MSYVNSVLQPGEHLQARSTLHWLIYDRAIVTFLIAIGCFIASRFVDPYGEYLLWIAGLFAAITILFFIPAWLRRLSTEIAVTDRRIIYKRGLIQRHTIEINMDKVESVDVDQSILGRLFDYGTITVRGTGEGIEPLRNISTPIALRNAVMVHPRAA
ncbi:MAG TPA: PH domain-containing protein [Beijerinckiaceae bacterium]|nr:PH domain-containing protein [Beijerinckiaceae bacterium]